jgi:Zn-dependent protease
MLEDAHFRPEQILSIPVFLFSLTVHEFAHALVATRGGDDTPRLQGRLTLNPGPHIDLFGTIILPLIGMFTSIPVIGWAKPVQVNPMRFKSQAWMVWVAIAGPISNLLIAIAACGALKVARLTMGEEVPQALSTLANIFVLVNIGLAVFNMLPIPPLDGSRVLFHFLVNGRPRLYPVWEAFERFSIFVLYIIIIAPVTRLGLGIAIYGTHLLLFNLFGLI